MIALRLIYSSVPLLGSLAAISDRYRGLSGETSTNLIHGAAQMARTSESLLSC